MAIRTFFVIINAILDTYYKTYGTDVSSPFIVITIMLMILYVDYARKMIVNSKRSKKLKIVSNGCLLMMLVGIVCSFIFTNVYHEVHDLISLFILIFFVIHIGCIKEVKSRNA